MESTRLGACLNMKDNDGKREEARMTSHFVSLWMARHLLRETMVEGQVWEEGGFRACQVGSTCGTFKGRCPADGCILGPETQERLYS